MFNLSLDAFQCFKKTVNPKSPLTCSFFVYFLKGAIWIIRDSMLFGDPESLVSARMPKVFWRPSSKAWNRRLNVLDLLEKKLETVKKL